MRWQVSWQAVVFAVLLFGGGLSIGCTAIAKSRFTALPASGYSPLRRIQLHRQTEHLFTYPRIRVYSSA